MLFSPNKHGTTSVLWFLVHFPSIFCLYYSTIICTLFFRDGPIWFKLFPHLKSLSPPWDKYQSVKEMISKGRSPFHIPSLPSIFSKPVSISSALHSSSVNSKLFVKVQAFLFIVIQNLLYSLTWPLASSSRLHDGMKTKSWMSSYSGILDLVDDRKSLSQTSVPQET
jgi:hypothetical protein